MKNKLFRWGICTAMITALMTGCASTGTNGQLQDTEEPDESTSESGTVSLTVWAEEDNFDMLNRMIDSFKEHYAGQADFEITLAAQADSSTKDVILGDIHSAADIFSFPDDQFSGLMAAGVLEPITNADEVSAANLDEAVAAASYNDTLYAYPYTADNGFFLYYDKNYFTEEDIQTLDGILAVAEASGKKFSMEFTSGWYSYAFFGQTGLEFGINDDGVTNYCNWNSTEGNIKGVDVAQALLNITASPAFSSNPDSDFPGLIQDGSVIAGISGTWNAVAVKEAWGEDYGAAKLPTFTCAGQQIQMSSFTGYKMMGVNAYSEHKEWAMKLADWLTNEENQTLRFVERNQGPSNKNAAASEEVAQVPAIQAVIDQSQYGNLQRVGGKYWDATYNFLETILAGNPNNLDLQELMDTLVAEITASTAE